MDDLIKVLGGGLLGYIGSYVIWIGREKRLAIKREKVAKDFLDFYRLKLDNFLGHKEPSKVDIFNVDTLTQYIDIYYEQDDLKEQFESFISVLLAWRNLDFIPNGKEYQASIDRVNEGKNKLGIHIDN